MAGEYNLTVVDYGGERSNVAFRGIDLTGANFAAQEAMVGGLLSAIQGVIIGEVQSTGFVAKRETVSADLPTDPFAQRENKWLVEAVDDVTGRPVRFEIPTADLALLDANAETMDTSLTQYTALKSTIETYARSVEGNAITVQRVIYVARNT